MTPGQYESIKRYVGFGPASEQALTEFHPVAVPHLDRIIVDFYETIEAHPEAMAVITGGSEQVMRLRESLRAWLDEVLRGPHDEGYLQRHARIGRVHVRINLPQEFMFTAMNRIRTQLLAVVDGAPPGSLAVGEVKAAVEQILDLELALMLDTYREDLLSKMRVRERLATLGQLSATIAHELRNPLGTIESSLYLMKRRLEKLHLADPVIDKHYERISEQVHSCGATIHALLDLARDRSLSFEFIGMRGWLEGVVAALRLPSTFTVKMVVADDFEFRCDPDQLAKAMNNLLGNALYSAGPTGRAIVSARRSEGSWILEVEDDGPGVEADARERIFELLYTTKPTGTGLGLPLARRIVEAHGGTLELVPSALGACFRMTLPDSSSRTSEG